jgi:hypothetical protein
MPDTPPPDPPDLTDPPVVSPAELKARLDETLERLARFEREMPRVVARIAAGLSDGKPPHKPDDRIAALERMLQDEQQRRIRTERENKVRAAVAGVPWVDPEDAVRDLLSKVEERDGQLVVMGTKKYAENGESFPEALPLDDAVRQLAKAKSHWIKADVKGGSGASGSAGLNGGGGGGGNSASTVAWNDIKYRDLKANPVLMQRAISEKGQSWVAALHDKWRQKQAKGQQFQI